MHQPIYTPISVVIITFNEASIIQRCIEAALPIADEIVILDSFSTDNTPAICQKYNLSFYQKEWQGYAATKNYANQLATNDWILSIDADEIISQELAHSILQWKKNTPVVASLDRITNYCGQWIKYSGWYPDYKVRLFNKNLYQWEGLIHEKLNINENSAQKLNGKLLHYSYHDLKSHYRQIEKFTDLAAQALFQRNKKPRWYHFIINPTFKFIKSYIIQLGFLDGKSGYLIAKISASGVYTKYKKLKDLHLKHENNYQ